MKKKSESLIAHIELSVGGEPRIMELEYPAKEVKLRRMLPVFQKASDFLVGLGIEKSKSENKDVSCKMGCSACCRQPIPISESEAHSLKKLVDLMPDEEKIQIKRRFDVIFDRLEKSRWFERVVETSLIRDDNDRRKKNIDLAREYYAQNIDCPFLKNESCSIYEDRPLICREYLVTSPAEYCADPFDENNKLEPVDAGIKTSHALFKMAIHKKGNRSTNFVPLIALFKWVDGFAENKEMKPGEKWLQEFFKVLAEN